MSWETRVGALRQQLCRVRGAASPDSWHIPFLQGLPHWSVSAPSVRTLPREAQLLGMPPPYPGELHDQQPHCALCQSPHLPDGTEEIKQSHHSLSCHHDAQHLHGHSIRQKKIFSLISDFPSPKPSCISRLTHFHSSCFSPVLPSSA